MTRGELQRILAQPEYQAGAKHREPGPSLLTQFMDWLTGLLARLGLSTASWHGVVLVIALLLAVAYGLIRLVWGLQTWRRSRAGTEGSQASPERMSRDNLLRLAAEAADRGEHRTALRYRYLALLRGLEMPEAPLRTNRQVLRWVGSHHPAARVAFADLVGWFEDTWYGGQPCTAPDYALAGELAQRVESQVAQDRQAAAAGGSDGGS